MKKQLIAYDQRFQRTHGRNPTREEKEPIRGKYIKYHAIKRHIAVYDNRILQMAASTGRISGRTESTGLGNATYPSEDLVVLKKEQRALNKLIYSYQTSFFDLNKREVDSYADIQPVVGHYHRYRIVKELIMMKKGILDAKGYIPLAGAYTY